MQRIQLGRGKEGWNMKELKFNTPEELAKYVKSILRSIHEIVMDNYDYSEDIEALQAVIDATIRIMNELQGYAYGFGAFNQCLECDLNTIRFSRKHFNLTRCVNTFCFKQLFEELNKKLEKGIIGHKLNVENKEEDIKRAPTR